MTKEAGCFTKRLEALSDEQLVVLAQEGDGEAQYFLMSKYKSLVRLKSRGYFIPGADAEDLLQEGMIGLYKAMRDYRQDKEASFKVFAELCIKRQLLTAVKAASRQKHIPLNTSISLNRSMDDEEGEKTFLDFLEGEHQNPEAICIDNESFGSLQKHLRENLSSFEKDVLALFLNGLSYVHIAKRLSISTKAVDNALQRIKKKMNKYLESERTKD